MFVFESCVFVLFLGACCFWSLLRDHIRERRDRQQAEHVSKLVGGLVGTEIQAVQARLGPPEEVIEGHFGRSLYIWKAPPSQILPYLRGILVVTLTTDAERRVTHAVWRKQ
jgi:hypothetical protein